MCFFPSFLFPPPHHLLPADVSGANPPTNTFLDLGLASCGTDRLASMRLPSSQWGAEVAASAAAGEAKVTKPKPRGWRVRRSRMIV